MEFDPDINDMEAHLALLYDWTHDQYRNARFEVRCLHPEKKSEHERFDCTPNGYADALFYAVKHNERGYNIYTTANPLKPGTNHAATDADVEIAVYHFVDADGVDDLDGLVAERSQGFGPTFSTLTGTVPKPRSHIYWRMSGPVTDMSAWSATQAGLAQHFATDETVKNPSRILRLAGTVSYPFPHKQKRGYVTGITSLQRTDNDEVCGHSFAACFPRVERLAAKPERTADDADGRLPLYIIEAALAAIPPIMGIDKRNVWLDIAQACRDANQKSFYLFDDWQRKSDRYVMADSKGWPRGLRHPSNGSWLSLFRRAKQSDLNWWQRDPEVWEWWRLNAALHHAETSPSDDAETPTAKPKGRFHRYKMSDLSQMSTPSWLIRDLLFEQQVSVVYAPPGSFKSFVILSLCSMLVHGMVWQGRKLKPCRVVYVAGEGFPMFRYRRLAWFKENNIPEHDDLLEVIEGAVNLTNTEEVLAFIEALQPDCNDLGLVVFDTLSTCIAGQNECDSAVMSLAVKNAKLIGRKLGCAILIIHHPGKDVERGSRGHSSLLGDIDGELRITRNPDEMACRLKVTKQKDGEDGQTFHFAASRVALGIYDDDNEEIYSLALSPVSLPGETVPTYLADRCSITNAMLFGERTSTAALAKKLESTLGKRSAAIKRINDAVPTEWTRVVRGERIGELRRTVAEKSGQPNTVELRISDTGRADNSDTGRADNDVEI